MSDTVARHDSDKRVIRTKKAIKAALFKIMEEKDISSITISELTEKANINRRTFYTHYRSITDILDEIEGDLVQALTELMRSFDVKEYRTSAYNLFMGLNDLISGEFDYYFQLVRVDMRGMLISRLKHVIKETTDKLLAQICRRTDDISMISSFIVGGFFNSYLEWHNHPERLTAEQAAELASSMVAFCVERISRKD
ncbi:MAG: TetR/AcrR family transcriptional regulator [Oscillospiraceae bacterium]